MTMTRGLIDRISLDETTGCWNFRGHIGKNGYGQVSYKGRPIYAHRLAAILWLRMPEDSSAWVCHRCDNRRCFNPKHLVVADAKWNVNDAVTKGRNPRAMPQTHCKLGHAIDGSNVRWNTVGKYTVKQCRICQVSAQKRRLLIRITCSCVECGVAFETAKHRPRKTCCRKCADVLQWKRRKQ